MRPKPHFDGEKIAEDMALRGWNASDLARACGLSVTAITMFLTGRRQTAKVAKKISAALKSPMKRYFVGVKPA